MANYTTATKVRAEAGFEGNPNISEDTIEKYLIQAHGIVQSYVSAVYKITNFVGSRFEGSQAQAMLSLAEDQIAAGLLLIKEYGLEGKGTESDGYQKKAEGEKLLQQISNPAKPLILVDNDGTEFERIPKAPAGTIGSTGITVGGNRFSVNDDY